MKTIKDLQERINIKEKLISEYTEQESARLLNDFAVFQDYLGSM